MEIKQLRQFRAVVDAGGIVRAAELLHVSAGTLSKAMRALESDFGHVLFRREGRRLVVNRDGAALYRNSERLIDEHARLRNCLANETPAPNMNLSLATFEAFSTHCLAPALTDLSGQIECSVLELPVEKIADAVLSGSADFGLTYVPIAHRDLRYRTLGRSRFRVYARRGRFDGCAFNEVPFAVPITPLRGSTSELAALDSWPYGRTQRLVRYRLTSLESALALARAGRCAVFLPEFVAATHNRTVGAPFALARIAAPARMAAVYQLVLALERRDAKTNEHAESVIAQIGAIVAAGDRA